ncbi:hypothetical protein L6R52_21430 [Myxococcota bacterium]|nr:hypothetical protein [Myxococcota bacterium]
MSDHHPIVDAAIHALAEDEHGLVLANRDALTRALAEHFDGPGLVEAVRELMVFALYVGEREGAIETARALFDVAATATPALERRALVEQEELRRVRLRAAELFAAPVAKTAPRLGAERPEGSISIASILSGLPGRRRG